MVDWPEGIPFFRLRSSYGAQPGENTLRTPMEFGPAKVRRRTTAAPSTVTGSAYMTREEAQRFEEFWRDTLLDGALSFTLADGLYRRRNLLVQSEDFRSGWALPAGTSPITSVFPDGSALSHTGGGIVTQSAGTISGQTETITAVIERVDSATSTIGIRDTTASVFSAVTSVTWATGAASGGGKFTPLGSGPNGGDLGRLTVSGAGTAGNARSIFVYPNGASANTGIIHWAQLEAAPAFTQYEPVGASYRSNDVTRGGLKGYRIVGVPQFAPMGLGHRVSVSLEVLP